MQDVHADLVRTDREIVVTTTRVGAFSYYPNARGIDTLMVGGVSSSGVVLFTIRDAAGRDYRLLVPADCCCDEPDLPDLLTGRVFPRPADVIDPAGLGVNWCEHSVGAPGGPGTPTPVGERRRGLRRSVGTPGKVPQWADRDHLRERRRPGPLTAA